MHCNAFLQAILMAFTALIFFQVREYRALPLRHSAPEPPASIPAARAARQVDPSHEHGTSNAFMDLWRSYRSTRSQSLGGGGFRVFPKKNRVDFYPVPNPEDETNPNNGTNPNNSTDPHNAVDPNNATDTASSASASASASAAAGGGRDGPKEITVKIANFQPNEKGENVYNAWPVTYGDRILDPRFHNRQPPRPALDPHPVRNYYPNIENLPTVCLNRTTIYNEYKIEKWLMRSLSSKKKMKRRFFPQLRYELFMKGQSESCHNENYTDWLKYQECALRRNQRMEYFIPRYPRQQLVD